MENGPFIDGLPLKDGDFPVRYFSHYRGVSHLSNIFWGSCFFESCWIHPFCRTRHPQVITFFFDGFYKNHPHLECLPRSIWSQEANAPRHFGDEKNVTPPLILGLVEAMFKRHLWCRCWRTRAWRRTRQDGTHGWLEMPFLQDFRRWQLVLGQNFWYHSPHHIFGGWTSICQPFFLMFTKVPEFSCVARWTYHAHQPASDLWFCALMLSHIWTWMTW